MFLPLTFRYLTLAFRACLVFHLGSYFILLIVFDNLHAWFNVIWEHLLDVFLHLIDLLVFILYSDHFKSYFRNEFRFDLFFIVNVNRVNNNKVIPIDLWFFLFLFLCFLFWFFLLEDLIFISLFDWFSNSIDWSKLLNFLDKFLCGIKNLWIRVQ